MRSAGRSRAAHPVPHNENFLRSFGLSSLEELPELPDASQEGGQLTLELEAAVARLRAEESGQTVQEDGAAHPAQEETE